MGISVLITIAIITVVCVLRKRIQTAGKWSNLTVSVLIMFTVITIIVYLRLWCNDAYYVVIVVSVIKVAGNETSSNTQKDIKIKENVAYEVPPSRIKMTENQAYSTPLFNRP